MLIFNNAVNRFFDALNKQASRFKVHDAELAELKQKYAFLKTSYYLEKKDQEILTRCGIESGEGTATSRDPKAAAEAATQMQKLMSNGRYEEMKALQEKAFGGADVGKKRKADNFGIWKKGLEDLAAASYRTKIKIDRDPHQWDVRWDKR